MRTMLLSFLCLTAACAADPTTTSGTVSQTTDDLHVNPQTDLTEPVYVNGQQCRMVFKGALTPETEVYEIWAIGVNGIVDAPYNTPRRPNLYAVFGTNPLPNEVHHVDGYNQFDHYHVIDGPDHGRADHVSNTNWDLLTLWPGPNYDPATYVSAKSVDELMAQSAAGILSPVLTLPEVGFPPLVLHSPIVCPHNDVDDDSN